MSVAKQATEPRVYELKVTLDGSVPAIWRRIRVTGDTTLARLHLILQASMGWGELHRHQFIVRGRRYGRPDAEGEVLDERRVRLGELVTRAGSRLTYEYDFDDGWMHEVLVEKVLPQEEGVEAPLCLAGERSCPPEDVGGIYGYYDLLDALQNGRSAGHRPAMEWVGGRWDPDAFDLETVNRRLSRIGRARRRRGSRTGEGGA
jgi:hypothetical protein